jgi:uncharacterized protein YecE (DUF72 family)
MDLRSGTSGYAYREWRGKFYPAGLPARAMLSFYAQRFSAVEINATFYRLPAAATLAAWRNQVPPHFLFACKAPGLITHRKRLHDTGAEISAFVARMATLGDQLGPLLFQLPPFLPCDLQLLRDFPEMPAGTRIAFEFRHPSWFDDAVYALLRERGFALCLADRDGAPPPLAATAGFGYVRLRRAQYGAAELRCWRKCFAACGWRQTFVFFRHEATGTGPAFATLLQGV